MINKSNYEPLVSIGLPVFNGQEYLKKSLESLISQDYKNIEIVISNNASLDGTESICLDYARLDPRIRYYKFSENKGSLKNFQNVLNKSSGEYFMWAADDDIWSKDWISSLLPLIVGSPDLAAFGSTIYIDENDIRISIPANYSYFTFNSKFKSIRRIQYIFTPHLYGKMILIYGLFNLNLLKKITKKDFERDEYYNGQDMYMVFDFLKSIKFLSNKKAVLYKRSHSKSQYVELIREAHTTNQSRSWFKQFSALSKLKSFLNPLRPVLYPLFFVEFFKRLNFWERFLILIAFPYYHLKYVIFSTIRFMKSRE